MNHNPTASHTTQARTQFQLHLLLTAIAPFPLRCLLHLLTIIYRIMTCQLRHAHVNKYKRSQLRAFTIVAHTPWRLIAGTTLGLLTWTMLQVVQRKYRAILETFLCWGGFRLERASSSQGTPHTAATRGRIRPCF